MKSNNCNDICSFLLVIFALVVVLMCLKYYYYCQNTEKFTVPSTSDLEHPHKNIKSFDPCSPLNFKKHLYHFYKAAEKYRNTEKVLDDARTKYEDTYKEFKDQQHKLDSYKKTLNNCIVKI